MASSSVEEKGDIFDVICGTRWRVCWVSPVQNLQYTEARLKEYAMQLRGALQSDSSVNCVVDAKVTALAELRRHKNAPIPLQITVEKIDGENERKCVYNGIMLSWSDPRRPGSDPRRPGSNNFVNLPLLLCRGGIKATEIVHKTLQAFLDCSIIGLTFGSFDMSWMIGFATYFHNAELDNLHLRFTTPGVGENENFLECTIQMELLKKRWRRINRPDQEVITFDKVEQLRNELELDLEKIYSFKVQMLQLIEIKWKGCSFSRNGYIKFSRELGKAFLILVERVGNQNEWYSRGY